MHDKLIEIFRDNQIVKKELDERAFMAINDNLNNIPIDMYVYTDDKNIEKEIFFVCNFNSKDANPHEFIKQFNSNIAYYINFISKNKEVFYNTYLILLITTDFENTNKEVILEISLDKNVMRKIFINVEKDNSFKEKLPFIDTKISINNSLETEENSYKDIISVFEQNIEKLEKLCEIDIDEFFNLQENEG